MARQCQLLFNTGTEYCLNQNVLQQRHDIEKSFTVRIPIADRLFQLYRLSAASSTAILCRALELAAAGWRKRVIICKYRKCTAVRM